MKNNLTYLLLAFFVIFFLGCKNSKVNISISKTFLKENSVIIDDSINVNKLMRTGTTFIELGLTKGNHTYSINKKTKNTFELNQEGILNLGNENFVIFPIDFTKKNNSTFSATGLHFYKPIIIENSYISYFPSLKNQEDIKKTFSDSKKSWMYSTDKFKFLNAKKTFIPKVWDYRLGNIPSKIKSGYEEEIKTCIIDSKSFLKLKNQTDYPIKIEKIKDDIIIKLLYPNQ